MENAKSKQFFYKHPYAWGLLSILISFHIINYFSIIPELGLLLFGDLFPDSSISEKTAALFHRGTDITTIIMSLACLLIYRLLFRKDGYKGCFTRPGLRNKEAWLFVLLGMLMDVVITAITAISAGIIPLMPTITTILISLRAGIFEETVFRGIPVSIMMTNKPNRKRMWVAVLSTSVIFGLIHIVNAGSSNVVLVAAIVQSVNALCFGMFFVAIYLRTGNILPAMIFHVLHDVIALMDPAQASGLYTTSSFTIIDFVVLGGIAAVYAVASIFMLRKSKWEEIENTWANIWVMQK